MQVGNQIQAVAGYQFGRNLLLGGAITLLSPGRFIEGTQERSGDSLEAVIEIDELFNCVSNLLSSRKFAVTSMRVYKYYLLTIHMGFIEKRHFYPIL